MQKYYIGRDWFFFWAHLDTDDNPVADFATNAYYLSLDKTSDVAANKAPIVRLTASKTVATGECYAEMSAASTASLTRGVYHLFYEVRDSIDRLIGLADRKITVEPAPEWDIS